ncbi:MAG: hypothetical protein K2R98_09175 [Gemmataceae bacterium]|nr:hypothetical protein [Gemmataceae bacterium]
MNVRTISKIAVPLVVAILSFVGGLIVPVFNRPDLRYEEGAYYRAGDTSVVSLKLENMGLQDADDITLQAEFPKPLAQAPQTNTESRPFVSPSAFKPGQEKVAGKIDRLVPGQVLYVYFTVQGDPGSLPQSRKSFVSEVTYKGGMGKTGRPFSPWNLVLLAAATAVGIGTGSLVSRYTLKTARSLTDQGKALLKDVQGLHERADQKMKVAEQAAKEAAELQEKFKKDSEQLAKTVGEVEKLKQQWEDKVAATSVPPPPAPTADEAEKKAQKRPSRKG